MTEDIGNWLVHYSLCYSIYGSIENYHTTLISRTILFRRQCFGSTASVSCTWHTKRLALLTHTHTHTHKHKPIRTHARVCAQGRANAGHTHPHTHTKKPTHRHTHTHTHKHKHIHMHAHSHTCTVCIQGRAEAWQTTCSTALAPGLLLYSSMNLIHSQAQAHMHSLCHQHYSHYWGFFFSVLAT